MERRGVRRNAGELLFLRLDARLALLGQARALRLQRRLRFRRGGLQDFGVSALRLRARLTDEPSGFRFRFGHNGGRGLLDTQELLKHVRH